MNYIRSNIIKRINTQLNETFKHPKNVCMTYNEHAKFSFQLSYVFLKGASQGVIHSIYPDTCITYAQDTIEEANKLLNNSGCKD